MSKSKAAKRKRNALQADLPKKLLKSSSASTPPLEIDAATLYEPKNLHTLISGDELELTVETLQVLTQHPSLVKSKACRGLRVAVYDFRQACTTGVNTSADTSLTARISAALTDGKYTDALVLLAEMRIRGEAPKLGALCRWVRDLDVVSGLSMQAENIGHTSASKTPKNLKLLRVLDAILRVTGPIDLNSEQRWSKSSHPIALQKVWSLRDGSKPSLKIRESVLDGTLFEDCPRDIKQRFEAIETTPGSLRKPPNLHDQVVWLTSENAVPLSKIQPSSTIHDHPNVPSLSLMRNVLSPAECKAIVAAMESVGFLPDAPIQDAGSDSSILAHTVCWVVDQAFHDRLWSRVRPHVPDHVSGKKARGINRRFRVYRYVPDAEYRCHIDGAWPPSGVHPITKSYQYDSSPPDAKQSSLFTFLIYLNDEFEGGETTFFVPGVHEGVMNAYPIYPVMGSVAVFPHGEAKGALLHEGTGVRKGAKYVIRTDVEYDVVASLL